MTLVPNIGKILEGMSTSRWRNYQIIFPVHSVYYVVVVI